MGSRFTDRGLYPWNCSDWIRCPSVSTRRGHATQGRARVDGAGANAGAGGAAATCTACADVGNGTAATKASHRSAGKAAGGATPSVGDEERENAAVSGGAKKGQRRAATAGAPCHADEAASDEDLGDIDGSSGGGGGGGGGGGSGGGGGGGGHAKGKGGKGKAATGADGGGGGGGGMPAPVRKLTDWVRDELAARRQSQPAEKLRAAWGALPDAAALHLQQLQRELGESHKVIAKLVEIVQQERGAKEAALAQAEIAKQKLAAASTASIASTATASAATKGGGGGGGGGGSRSR